MSGPMRSLSGMIDDVRSETSRIIGITDRLRNANRHLTGSTGQAPTPLNPAGTGDANIKQGEPPLMVMLTVDLEALRRANQDLVDEVSFLEGISETGAPQQAGVAVASR